MGRKIPIASAVAATVLFAISTYLHSVDVDWAQVASLCLVLNFADRITESVRRRGTLKKSDMTTSTVHYRNQLL